MTFFKRLFESSSDRERRLADEAAKVKEGQEYAFWMMVGMRAKLPSDFGEMVARLKQEFPGEYDRYVARSVEIASSWIRTGAKESEVKAKINDFTDKYVGTLASHAIERVARD